VASSRFPDLTNDFSPAGDDLGWTITSYSLVFGSLLLFGRTRRRPARAAPHLLDQPRVLDL